MIMINNILIALILQVVSSLIMISGYYEQESITKLLCFKTNTLAKVLYFPKTFYWGVLLPCYIMLSIFNLVPMLVQYSPLWLLHIRKVSFETFMVISFVYIGLILFLKLLEYVLRQTYRE